MSKDEKTVPTILSRRQALMKLGVAAGAAYAAPVLLQLSNAHASGAGAAAAAGAEPI